MRLPAPIAALLLALLGAIGCSAADRPGSPDAADGDLGAETDAAGPVFENPVYALVIEPEDLALLDQDVDADVEVPAVLVADGARYELEVEYQGASARSRPKKSYALKFRGDQPFRRDPFGDGGEPDGFRRLVLKAMGLDQSLVREALAFDVLRALGGRAPRVALVNVTRNGEDQGLYALVEPVDEDFLRRRGLAPGGALYKGVDQRADFRPGRDLHQAFEKKTLEDEPWVDLEAFVALLQDTPATEADFLAAIGPVFDLDDYIRRMIWVSYTQNVDAVSQNFYLYAEPRADAAPLWHVLPWDSDVCLSNHWKASEPLFPVEWRHLLDGRNHFGRRFVSIDAFRHRLVDRFEALLDTTLSPAAVLPLAEARFARAAADLARDQALWARSSAPQTEFAEIRAFIEQRPAILREKLALFRDDPDVPDLP